MSKKNDIMTFIPAEQYELRYANVKRAYKTVSQDIFFQVFHESSSPKPPKFFEKRYTTSIKDTATGGNFANSVKNTGGEFAFGVNATGSNIGNNIRLLTS